MASPPPGDGIPHELKRELIEAIDSLHEESTELQENLHNTIERWLSSATSRPTKTSWLAYHLEDSSDNKALSLDGLAPSDLLRYRCLERLGAQHKFNVFISEVQKRVVGNCCDLARHDMSERTESEDETDAEEQEDLVGTIYDSESTWSIQVRLDTSNGWKTPSLALKGQNFLQGDIFEDCEPDEDGDPSDQPEDPHLYTFVHYYRSLPLAIVPQSMTAFFLSNFPLKWSTVTESNDLITHFSTKCTTSDSDGYYLGILSELCLKLFPQQDTETEGIVKFPEETIAKVLEVATRARNLRLFEMICTNIKVDLSPQFFTWIAERMEGTGLPFKMLEPALNRTIFAAPSLGDRYRTIFSLNILSTKASPAFRELVLVILDKVVHSCYDTDRLYEQDGEALVLMASTYRDYDWLLKKVRLVVYQRRRDHAFLMGFNWQLYTNIRQNKLQIHDSIDYLKSSIRTLLQEFDVSLLLSVNEYVR
ncbi:hypothetical protein F5X99DRAFT_40188 [Biscogniauxia marginata]|nr:hypothetical protein F5X99DRAFT_40188 [Biscogniauxia marginata]